MNHVVAELALININAIEYSEWNRNIIKLLKKVWVNYNINYGLSNLILEKYIIQCVEVLRWQYLLTIGF